MGYTKAKIIFKNGLIQIGSVPVYDDGSPLDGFKTSVPGELKNVYVQLDRASLYRKGKPLIYREALSKLKVVE